jgi:hypothetical protein
MACLNRIGRTSAGHCLGAPTPKYTPRLAEADIDDYLAYRARNDSSAYATYTLPGRRFLS